ncbi:MAG: hypothetical protein HY800_02760 [Ignavibacteriales bacterium]|nr:hypothetical protein [Ignavibacteriales bacterium]
MNIQSEQPRPNSNETVTVIWLIIGFVSIVITSIIGINDNPPGIVLLLLGGFSLVYAFVHRLGASKNLRPALQLLYWSPRVLTIVFIAFTCLFAADVFSESRGFWETALALLMHLIPQLIVIGLLIVLWHREWIVGVICLLLSIAYIINVWGRFGIDVYILIGGPLALIGVLFLLNWRYRVILRPSSQS